MDMDRKTWAGLQHIAHHKQDSVEHQHLDLRRHQHLAQQHQPAQQQVDHWDRHRASQHYN